MYSRDPASREATGVHASGMRSSHNKNSVVGHKTGKNNDTAHKIKHGGNMNGTINSGHHKIGDKNGAVNAGRHRMGSKNGTTRAGHHKMGNGTPHGG